MNRLPILLQFFVTNGWVSSFLVCATVSTCTLSSPPLVSNGLRNVGNTCYINAQLQCLFHIPAVRNIVLSSTLTTPIKDNVQAINVSLQDGLNRQQEKEQGQKKNINVTTEASLALKELFEGMVQAATEKSSTPYMPRPFCEKLGIKPMIQQDSQEFWKLLLSALGSEKLTDLYKGVYEDYIAALDGTGREKRRDEVFLDLSLDIQYSSTLLGSLKEAFGKPELLKVSDGNGWRPQKGEDKVNAHKGSSLVAKGLPPILQFHLKRFNYDWKSNATTKINKRFTFQKDIDLASVCVDARDKNCETKYDLQAVIVHMGEYDVGHYYAYVRPDIQNNKWYRFNDDIVEEVTFEDMKIDAFGGKKRMKGLRHLFGVGKKRFGLGDGTSNAYVIQYVRRREIHNLYYET